MHHSSRWALFLLAVTLVLAAVPLISGLGTPSEARQRDTVLAQQAALSLSTGEVLPRWAPGLGGGHGSPWFLFHAPLGYVLPGSAILLGLPVPLALLLVLLACLGGAGYLAYLLGRELWGPQAGAVLALLYLFFPAHLSRLQSLSGALALCWPPLALWAVAAFARRPYPRYAALATLALAALALTDLPAACGLAVALTLYLLLAGWRARALDLAVMAGSAVALTAFFWLPAWWESGHLLAAPVAVPLGGAGPVSAWLLLTAFLGAGAASWLRSRDASPPRPEWGRLSIGVAAVALILAGLQLQTDLLTRLGPVSTWFDPLPVLGLSLPLAGAFLAHGRMDGSARWLLPVLALALAAGAYRAVAPAAPGGWDVPPEFRPATVSSLPPPGRTPLFPAPAGCRLDQERSQATLHFFDAVCAQPGVMQTQLFHYPGWTVQVDNQEQQPRWDERHGRLRIALSAGVQRVKVSFGHTPLRRNAQFLSLAALVLTAAWWLTRTNGKQKEP